MRHVLAFFSLRIWLLLYYIWTKAMGKIIYRFIIKVQHFLGLNKIFINIYSTHSCSHGKVGTLVRVLHGILAVLAITLFWTETDIVNPKA